MATVQIEFQWVTCRMVQCSKSWTTKPKKEFRISQAPPIRQQMGSRRPFQDREGLFFYDVSKSTLDKLPLAYLQQLSLIWGCGSKFYHCR